MSTEALQDYQARPVRFAKETEGIARGKAIAGLLTHQDGCTATETLGLIRRMSAGVSMVELFQGRHALGHDTIPEQAIAVRHGLSSVIGTDLMTDLATVAIVAGTESEPDTTEGWTRVVPLPNFKDANVVVNDTVPRPGKLGRGGSAPFVSMTMATDSWKLTRFAAQFVIDEQDRIDTEHFDLWADALQEVGRSFARLKADMVYSLLLANSTTPDGTALFHADHDNLETAALGATALQTCRKNIAGRVLTDDSGVPSHLNLDGRYLICPPDLADSGRIIARSIIDGLQTVVVRGGSDLVVRSESRLGTAGVFDHVAEVIRTGTATNYLVAAPASQRPCILVGALDGRVQPTVSSFRLSNGQWGMGVQINLDLGVTAADYRGLCWSTGAGG